MLASTANTEENAAQSSVAAMGACDQTFQAFPRSTTQMHAMHHVVPLGPGGRVLRDVLRVIERLQFRQVARPPKGVDALFLCRTSCPAVYLAAGQAFRRIRGEVLTIIKRGGIFCPWLGTQKLDVPDRRRRINGRASLLLVDPGKIMKARITFSAQGTVTQTVAITDPGYTPLRLVDELNSGELLTTLQANGSVEITRSGVVVATVVDMDNNFEYSDFALRNLD